MVVPLILEASSQARRRTFQAFAEERFQLLIGMRFGRLDVGLGFYRLYRLYRLYRVYRVYRI